MNELVEFIRARIEEDEMVAVAATRGPWTWTAPRGYPQQVSNSRAVLIAETYTNPAFPAYDIEHIVRHDPNRVFREVAAKRKLLDDLFPDIQGMDGMIEGEWGHHNPAADRLLEVLALPYADHDDYREEWRP
ncbi:DUF6221 family protein [Streptosporangium sp. NPDC049078]|uniref:DUF6221 family protein n=1 Tax=Streptosporangium sp. NPDC049078 TaxID=3155767 RepID=UPI00341718B3